MKQLIFMQFFMYNWDFHLVYFSSETIYIWLLFDCYRSKAWARKINKFIHFHRCAVEFHFVNKLFHFNCLSSLCVCGAKCCCRLVCVLLAQLPWDGERERSQSNFQLMGVNFTNNLIKNFNLNTNLVYGEFCGAGAAVAVVFGAFFNLFLRMQDGVRCSTNLHALVWSERGKLCNHITHLCWSKFIN